MTKSPGISQRAQLRTLRTENPRTSEVLIKKPLLFFVSAFVAQGVALHVGIIDQPLKFFLMKHEGLSAAATSIMMSSLMIPWVIKPIYGFVSDLLPFLGYKRRSYLLLSNMIAGSALLGAAFVCQSQPIIAFLIVASLGLAFSNVVLNALTVDLSRRQDSFKQLWSTQSISFYSANVASLAAGGWLCDRLGPGGALRTAAIIASLFPLFLMLLAKSHVCEQRQRFSKRSLRITCTRMLALIKDKGFLSIGAYMCLFNFSPQLSVPVYYFEVNKLGFSQTTIGNLNACTAIGMLGGAVLFKLFIEKKLNQRQQLIATCISSAAANSCLVFLSNSSNAIWIHSITGVACMLAILSLYRAAASACPRRVEALAFGILLGTYNLAGQIGQILGGSLFSHCFNECLTPLIWVSIATTLCCVPFALSLPMRGSSEN